MKNIIKTAERYLSRFICYAVIGWLYEVSLGIFEQHHIVNRGFCLGPWLPIYGFGGMLLYSTIYRHAKKPLPLGHINIRPFLIFLAVSISAASVELVSTYIMGLAGLDFRTLWTYGDYAINYEERIALLPALKFGLLGCAIIYFFQEKIDAFINSHHSRIVYARYLICVIFAADVLVHAVNGSNYTGIPIFYL